MDKLSLLFNEEFAINSPIESSCQKIFNSSSKALSKSIQTSKFVISPKKDEASNGNSTNERTIIYSVKRSYNNKKKGNINEYKSICRKLDFSDNSNNNNNNSNYSISDNENIEINEDYSDFSLSSLDEDKPKKKKK